jgi:hypothetical protein
MKTLKILFYIVLMCRIFCFYTGNDLSHPHQPKETQQQIEQWLQGKRLISMTQAEAYGCENFIVIIAEEIF